MKQKQTWISIYIQQPKEGQLCTSRKNGQVGYVGKCIYTQGYFTTYHDHPNRLEIIRWKHDEWMPLPPVPTTVKK